MRVQTMIHEAMDENLDTEVDPDEWNWQAMADRANKMWGLKLTDKQLKKIGRDEVAEFIIKEAEQVVKDVDLTKGKGLPGAGLGHSLALHLVRSEVPDSPRPGPARPGPGTGGDPQDPAR